MNPFFRRTVPLAALWLIAGAALAQDQAADSTAALATKVESMAENLTTINNDLEILKWLKVSGYLQMRYEANDSSKSTDTLIRNSPVYRNANNLYIRRGRIKFTLQAKPSSRFVFYIDASRNTISLKEAYLDLIQSYNGHRFTLTAGQFNIPFGYEIEYSSSKRDFPERSLGENALFRGERDRGLNLTWQAPKYVSANVGVFQGYGIENSTFTWFDPTSGKDILARGKVKLGNIDFGLSGYWGKTFVPGTAGSTTWYDRDGDKTVDTNEVTTVTPKLGLGDQDKIRYGADAQVYLDVLPLGNTGIRGELLLSQDYSSSAGKVVDGRGFYLWLSQNLGKRLGAAARYDVWDPNTDSGVQNDATGTLSLAGHYYYDGNIRITAAYDMPRKLEKNSLFTALATDPDDNRFTLQFQYTL